MEKTAMTETTANVPKLVGVSQFNIQSMIFVFSLQKKKIKF